MDRSGPVAQSGPDQRSDGIDGARSDLALPARPDNRELLLVEAPCTSFDFLAS